MHSTETELIEVANNPDCCSAELLRKVSEYYSANNGRLSEATEILENETTETIDTNGVSTLMTYCNVKAQAIEYRINGHISKACSLERKCELLYNTLPSILKW